MSKRSSKPLSKLTPEQIKLVESHIGLAKNLARKVTRKDSVNLQSYEDLESVAYIGLCHAATLFDASKGFAFSTYATTVIKGELIKANRKGSSGLSISEGMHVIIWHINKAVNNGVPETVEALSEALNESPNKIRQALQLKVSIIGSKDTNSLSDTNPESESDYYDSFLDVLVSDDTSVEEQVEANIEAEAVNDAIAMLPPKFRELIRYRFGFTAGVPMLSEEVREILNLDVDTYNNMESAAMEYLEAILRGYRKNK